MTTNEQTNEQHAGERAELIRKLHEIADTLNQLMCEGEIMGDDPDTVRKASALLEADAQQPAIKPLTDEQCDAIYVALDEWAREFDNYEFGLPRHCGGGIEGGREVIRKAAHGIKGQA